MIRNWPHAPSATCTSSMARPPTCCASRCWPVRIPFPSQAEATAMFGYYFKLALRSFGRNRMLTALMVLAIGLGIGAAMTTLTVFKVLAGDPIPSKSDRLFYVQLDPRPRDGYVEGEEPEEQLTRIDAANLLAQARAPRQAMMTGGGDVVAAPDSSLKPFISRMRYTSADFFPMFEVPMVAGQAWSAAD